MPAPPPGSAFQLGGDPPGRHFHLLARPGGNADGNRHTHEDLPVLIAGGAGGRIAGGRHVVYPAETPMTNLYVTLLDYMGVPVDSLGDSTGHLAL